MVLSIVGAYQRPYTMTCSGDNIRTWVWISNGDIVTNSSDGRVQVWSNGQLHFTSLQYGDGGIYYCHASNLASNFYDINKYAIYRLTLNGVCACACVCACVFVSVRLSVHVQLECLRNLAIELLRDIEEKMATIEDIAMYANCMK